MRPITWVGSRALATWMGPLHFPKNLSHTSLHIPTTAVDAVNSAHSAHVSKEQAAAAARQLVQYLARYRGRLGPGSCLALQQLLLFARALDVAMTAGVGKPPQVLTLNQFTFDAGLEGVNVYHLLR